MLKRLIFAVLATGMIAVGEVPTVDAQQASKQHALTTEAARPQLRDAIARMTDLNSNAIEIHTTNTLVRVRLVNTLYNGDRPSDREYLASTIAALLAQKAKNDPALEKSQRPPYRISEARRLVYKDRRHHGIPEGPRRRVCAPSDLKRVQMIATV